MLHLETWLNFFLYVGISAGAGEKLISCVTVTLGKRNWKSDILDAMVLERIDFCRHVSK